VPARRRRSKTSKTSSRRKALAAYEEKRDFGRTPEPAPQAGGGEHEDGLRFVVQKHAARRLHYDLRLEHAGTLKSWAVTRGPSLIAGEKRLAVRTEDHPLAYLDFEGNIPKGEYGGGAMIVWDRGRWESEFDPDYGLEKGHLDITLYGRRLRGRWHLVRMRRRPREKNEQWLLIKSEDQFARRRGEVDITDEETTSYLSGRTTEQLAAKGEVRKDHAGRRAVIAERSRALPDPKAVRGARKAILPAFVEPSLAESTERPPRGPEWVHEIKYDGYRIQARIDGKELKLLTRSGLDWTARFPTIAAACRAIGWSSALLDGEVIVEDSAGLPSFTDLQTDLKAGRADRFRYVLFDILYCEGFDLRNATLLNRKALLQQIAAGFPEKSPLRFSEHLAEDGPTMFDHACRLGLEGIVSKRIDLPYRSGRGPHWLKSKSVLRQEFVIVGHVPSTVAKGSLGALVLGYFDRGVLYYAGRVGTGYSADLSRSLRVELEKIAAPKPRLANALPAGADKGVRWTEPRLVCEVEFGGWTADQLIRQASFKGIREDRAPEEVVVESAFRRTGRGRAGNAARWHLTHADRILWPEQGVTKEGLAEFYGDIAQWILPHIRGRVLSLVRCPGGVSEKCFFAKHEWEGLSGAMRRIDVGEKEKMLALDTLDELIELVQASVLEIHPWGSSVARLENPDRLTFDLDPGEDVPWSAVIDAGFDVRQRLEASGLRSFVKTSGGKGLHVVVPVEAVVGWDEAKAFTQSVAEQMAKERPERYVATMAKRVRRGRIFVDYLRNGRGATAVAAYSTRALPQASVSTPLAWDELSEGVRADHFRIGNLRQRLAAIEDDPWPDFFKIRQRIPAAKRAR
jgi:bifunctional non-homologous end joining protein LigD